MLHRVLWLAALAFAPVQAGLISFTFEATSSTQIVAGEFVDFAVSWTYSPAGFVELMIPGGPEPGPRFLGWQYWHVGVIEWDDPEAVSATFTVTTTPGASFTEGVPDFSGTQTRTFQLHFPDPGVYSVDLLAVIASRVRYQSTSYDAQRFCTFFFCDPWDKRPTPTNGNRDTSITPATVAIPVEVGIPEPALAWPALTLLALLIHRAPTRCVRSATGAARL